MKFSFIPSSCVRDFLYDLREEVARIVERRQVIDLPQLSLWVVEHHVEEMQCPCGDHQTRVSFN